MSQIELPRETFARLRRATDTELIAAGGAIVMDDPRRAETPVTRAARLARKIIAAWGVR